MDETIKAQLVTRDGTDGPSGFFPTIESAADAAAWYLVAAADQFVAVTMTRQTLSD